MKLRELLQMANREVITTGPNDTLSEAVQKLARHNRGSLPVLDEHEHLVGILTERDIVRKCFARMDSCDNVKVKEIMTKEVIIGHPDDDADYAVMVMKQKRIRHLPVVENDKVIGLVSMRDLLDVQLENCKLGVRYSQLLPKRTQRPMT